MGRSLGDRKLRSHEERPATGWALLNKATTCAIQGQESACRIHAAEAGTLAMQNDSPLLDVGVDHVLGLLELSLGNFGVAVWHLSRCAKRRENLGIEESYLLRFEPDLVESLAALGRRDEAVRVTRAFSRRAKASDFAWAHASAARCRALLSDETSFDRAFGAALALAESESPFELARTRLLYGERLRRARRRIDARQPLRAALEGFNELGATPWAQRAARELDATSQTARPRCDLSRADDLTPQEHSVVGMIAEGATIREAAGRLFLSPKTVEAHLGRVYRKLGVRNRAQLAMRVARA